MSTQYQAIFDAIKLEASGLSWAIDLVKNEALYVAATARAPHVLMRPRVYQDGDQWCALYGENIMEGVCGFGDSPALACAEFDKAWEAK